MGTMEKRTKVILTPMEFVLGLLVFGGAVTIMDRVIMHFVGQC